MGIKLHLGCGEKHIDGYINIDIRHMSGVDKVDNIRFLRSFKDNSVDVIYACSVLEHFSRWDYMSVLKRWYDLLKIGGIIRIGVPDFESIVSYYNKNKDLLVLIGLLYGGQDYNENFHHMCWDFKNLKLDLEKIGFKNVNRYNWKDTEHFLVDDFSQAYLPHMDKEYGLLMHLNVEAKK